MWGSHINQIVTFFWSSEEVDHFVLKIQDSEDREAQGKVAEDLKSGLSLSS